MAILGACDLPATLGVGFSVEIGRDELEMVVGDTVAIDANVRNAKGGSVYFRWTSSRPEVARVEASRLIGVSPGTTVVTVTAWTHEDGDTDRMTVRVRP
ncbi:MAG TPA: Ig-like domain-containing protein [Longimicrobiales bacterium]